jgi:ParB family chromosome partitioning protein
LTHADPVKVAKEIIRRDLSVRQTEALVNQAARVAKPAGVGAAHRGDADIEALANGLSERLGLKVQIKFNGKSGAVVLNYADLDQLDTLLALLNG